MEEQFNCTASQIAALPCSAKQDLFAFCTRVFTGAYVVLVPAAASDSCDCCAFFALLACHTFCVRNTAPLWF